MKSITVLALLLLGTFTSKAQYFLQPIDNGMVTMAKEVYAVDVKGDTTFGRINICSMINGQMRSFTIKKKDKSKVKFKAADVTLLAVKPTNFMNFTSAMSVPNIQRASEMDFDKILKREWVYFEQATLPNKEEKFALMQLLNPGFDSKIKVYLNPNANETATTQVNGIQVSGGEDKSYIVVFDGGKSELYKKNRYNKEALSKLYKDCEVFAENYEGEKFKWRDFSEHVLVYDQLCK